MGERRKGRPAWRREVVAARPRRGRRRRHHRGQAARRRPPPLRVRLLRRDLPPGQAAATGGRGAALGAGFRRRSSPHRTCARFDKLDGATTDEAAGKRLWLTAPSRRFVPCVSPSLEYKGCCGETALTVVRPPSSVFLFCFSLEVAGGFSVSLLRFFSSLPPARA